MKLLVTGGFGYLGGCFSKYIVENTEHDLIVATRKKNAAPAWLQNSQIAEIQWDSAANLEELCSEVDIVVHMSGMNAGDCSQNYISALEVNAVSTARLLHSAIRKKVKRFIYLSTAHVYASPLTGYIDELKCATSLHPYATSHRAGEDVVRYAHDMGEIEGVVLRLSNVFGFPIYKDANCWMLLVNDLCQQACFNRTLKLKTAGFQRRDFLTLSNFQRALYHVINLDKTKIGDGLFNIGGDCVLRVIEMAEMIQARCEVVLGFRPEIIKSNMIQNESGAPLEYSIRKIKKTGFELVNNFHDEIDDTLMYCNDMRGGL